MVADLTQKQLCFFARKYYGTNGPVSALKLLEGAIPLRRYATKRHGLQLGSI